MVKRTLACLLGLCLAESSVAEVQINAGWQKHQVRFDTQDTVIDASDPSDNGYHAGIAARKNLGKSQRHWFGVGVDVSEILDQTLVGLRALDYQYQIYPHVRIGAFFGAATLDTGSMQNGYYTGINLTATDVGTKNLNVILEFRHGDGLARDRLLASDPEGTQPDIFLDFDALSLSVGYRF